MEYDVVIPNFDKESNSVTVAKWYKKSGDKVKRGEILADIDSDTSSCSVVAPVDGVLAAIFVPEELSTQVGSTIGAVSASEETTSSYISSENIKKVEDIYSIDDKIEQEEQNVREALQKMDAEAAFQGSVEGEESPEHKLNANLEALKHDTGESIHNIYNKIEQSKGMHDYYNPIFTSQPNAEETTVEEHYETQSIQEPQEQQAPQLPPEENLNLEIPASTFETPQTETVKIIDADNPDFITVRTRESKMEDIIKANDLSKEIDEEKPGTDPDKWNKVKKIATPDETIFELGELETSLANRRKKATSTAVISTVINEINMSAIIDAAKFFGDLFYDKYNIHIGYTAFILKAVVKALAEYPMFNAYILDNNEVVFKKNYDISIVTQGLDSLPSPVIRNVDMLNIKEIQEAVTHMSKRAKNGELTLEESSGATFTVVNSGIYGSLLGSDVVTYPQIATLSMHKVSNRPIVTEEGAIVAKPMMYISMSFDHRIANSQAASLFLQKVKQLSENLSWMALGI